MKRYSKFAVVLGLAFSMIMCGCVNNTNILNENSINADSTEIPKAEVEKEQESVIEDQEEVLTEVSEEVIQNKEEAITETLDEIIKEDVMNQLTIIAENKDMWATDLDFADEMY